MMLFLITGVISTFGIANGLFKGRWEAVVSWFFVLLLSIIGTAVITLGQL